MSNSSGRAKIFGQAVTGAPGDSNRTCASSGCHSAGAFSPEATLTVFDGDGQEVTSYTPGKTYDVKLSIETTGDPSAFGFQMVALTSTLSPATDWKDLDASIQMISLGDRNYIEQKSPSASNEFSTRWTAPENGGGDITFYFSANAVNSNGSPSGDGGTNSTFILSEKTTSTENLGEIAVNVYPNPATQFISLNGLAGSVNYSIYTSNGQLVSKSFTHENTPIDISNFENGLYFIQINEKDKSLLKRFYIN